MRLLNFKSMLAAGLVIAAASGLAFDRLSSESGDARIVPVKLTVDATPVDRERDFRSSYSSVLKNVTPSVVNVYTSKDIEVSSSRSLFEMDPFLRQFFGDRFENQRRQQQNRPVPKQQGLGSGVIVTSDGYILTNNHVVEEADEIKVALNDGSEYEATLVGADPATDVAVLKIDEDNLPYLTAADSSMVEVGDVVLAIGNPFGVGQTVTMGIVSGTGRQFLGREMGASGLQYEDFIQTDAAINPGNSGGALVDSQGRLIGVNTAILSRSGGNNGIGFAIPTNLAKGVMENLVANGRVVRGYIGIGLQNVTPELASAFALEDNKGALVTGVEPGTPAEKAKIRDGDVIVEFDGKTINDPRELSLAVSQKAPGTETSVKVIRDGKEKLIEVKLGERGGDTMVADFGENSARNTEDLLDGIVVDDVSRNARTQMNVPNSVSGAVVVQVDPNSPAYEAGLREGDIIQEINRKTVDDADEAVELSEEAIGKAVLLRVWNQGQSRYLVVQGENK